MIITNPSNGRQFYVRVVFQGDHYGLMDCLTHDKPEPMIEFYDWKYSEPGPASVQYKHGARGQFVSRYMAGTLSEHPGNFGLDLYGSEPMWKVDAEALAPVLATAKALLRDFQPDDRGYTWIPKPKPERTST